MRLFVLVSLYVQISVWMTIYICVCMFISLHDCVFIFVCLRVWVCVLCLRICVCVLCVCMSKIAVNHSLPCELSVTAAAVTPYCYRVSHRRPAPPSILTSNYFTRRKRFLEEPVLFWSVYSPLSRRFIIIYLLYSAQFQSSSRKCGKNKNFENKNHKPFIDI